MTVLISLHYKETKQFYLNCSCKKKKIVQDSSKENLKVTKNNLPNKSGNPESLKK